MLSIASRLSSQPPPMSLLIRGAALDARSIDLGAPDRLGGRMTGKVRSFAIIGVVGQTRGDNPRRPSDGRELDRWHPSRFQHALLTVGHLGTTMILMGEPYCRWRRAWRNLVRFL